MESVVSQVVAEVTSQMPVNWAAWASATGTFFLGVVAVLQIKSRNKELRDAQEPHLAVKDVWVKQVTSDEGRATFWFISKGIANLGAFSIVIHQVDVLDGDGKRIASSHPMTVIPTGQAIGVGKEDLFEPVRSQESDPIPYPEVANRAWKLVFRFTSGTIATKRWRFELERVHRDHRKDEQMTFSGAKSEARPDWHDDEGAEL